MTDDPSVYGPDPWWEEEYRRAQMERNRGMRLYVILRNGEEQEFTGIHRDSLRYKDNVLTFETDVRNSDAVLHSVAEPIRWWSFEDREPPF